MPNEAMLFWSLGTQLCTKIQEKPKFELSSTHSEKPTLKHLLPSVILTSVCLFVLLSQFLSFKWPCHRHYILTSHDANTEPQITNWFKRFEIYVLFSQYLEKNVHVLKETKMTL